VRQQAAPHDRKGAPQVSFTVAVDTAASFSVCIFMGCEVKADYNTGEAQRNAAGLLKWSVTIAAQTNPVGGQRSTAETISITIPAADDPCEGLPPGTPVVLEDLRVGTVDPEMRGDRIRGGKPYFQASGVRSMVPVRSS
jgi:hypothetical protein